jgi:hypothetical protein
MVINPKFKKLITALRTAVENGEGVLDLLALTEGIPKKQIINTIEPFRNLFSDSSNSSCL